MKLNYEKDMDIYWNHNTAYHKWILSHVKGKDSVLDVGCGDGLLVYRLANVCNRVVGIDSHMPSIEKARKRLNNISNASIKIVGFEDFDEKPESYDVIIFVASIHHMDLKKSIRKSVKLLKPNGELLIVGLAHPKSIIDYIIEVSRILPAKIGDLFHNVKSDVGAPIKNTYESLEDIRKIVCSELPNAKIKQALYYRYLLSWIKPNKL